MISLGARVVFCSSKVDKIYSESRTVPGMTVPPNPLYWSLVIEGFH